MTNPNSIDPTQFNIRTTAPRMTAPPALRTFGEVLASRGEAVLQTALRTVGFVPGGALLAAAVRGSGSSVGASSVSSPEGPATPTGVAPGTTGGDDMLARSQEMSMQFLQLQEQISQENRQYTALSNVLHVRHESAKNAIGNVR